MVRADLDVCPPSRTSDGVHLNKRYVTSIANINKAVQFVLFMFSFALSSHFKSSLIGYEELVHIHSIPLSKLDLHIFVMGLSSLLVFTIIATYAFNLIVILSDKMKYAWEMMAGLHIVGAIGILITASITLHNALFFRHHICNIRPVLQCSVYDGAGALSFFAVLSMTFDAVLHIFKARQSYRQRQQTSWEEPDQNCEGGTEGGEVNQSYEQQTESVTS